MTWLQRYRVRHYVSNSLWVYPMLSIGAALAAVRILHWIEVQLAWESDLSPSTAQAFLGTMASSLFTFIVFVSSALLVAVQLASSQLTPRIIAIVFRDPITRASLVVFVFTFTFTLSVLVRVSTVVPLLTARVAAYGSLVSLCVFLFLIDHVGKSLRPSGALWAVACSGRRIIANVYPRRLAELPIWARAPITLDEEPVRTITCQRDGVVLAFDISGLLILAQRADCIIELVPQVGDFVAVGDPLFRIFQGRGNLPTEAISHSVAVGQERTLEQDPTLAFRILVDIASKGLSPAINDPTTAVLALDQIHHLLRDVGHRHLDDERVRDKDGPTRLRLLYRTPDWEDFVYLAVTEIRHFGGGPGIPRLPGACDCHVGKPDSNAARRAAVRLLRQELILLHRSAERFFVEPEDRVLAGVSDFQGVGGKQERSQAKRQVKGAPPNDH